MDLDPDLAWPFWKFGLKQDDLFTKLHDQYNTFPSSIQDPEAFHHDVYECSQEAGTTDEFHRLLATRKEQRLRELNTSLESASLEIIANPSLIGTDRWQFALQLFRTKSLDSLVRYFASYLPDNHPWREAHSDSGPPNYGSNTSDDKSTIHTHIPAFDEPSFFDDAQVTHEPFSINALQSHLPPSPRSMTMCSDSSVDNRRRTNTHHTYILHNLSPARTLSFSESESERFNSEHLHDESSQPDSPISDYSEPFSEPAAFDTAERHEATKPSHLYHNDDEPSSTATAPSQLSVDSGERDTDTPTPKPTYPNATPFFDTRPSSPVVVRRRGISFSPSRAPHPLAQVHSLLPHDEQTSGSRPVAVSTRLRRRDHSPGRGRRRSPGEPATRVQKSLPGHVGSRLRGRRRLEEC
jgi:hypothetical protein